MNSQLLMDEEFTLTYLKSLAIFSHALSWIQTDNLQKCWVTVKKIVLSEVNDARLIVNQTAKTLRDTPGYLSDLISNKGNYHAAYYLRSLVARA